ncbi:MAG: hypothetical protein VCB25_09625, partial [Myxococcota bacterium]
LTESLVGPQSLSQPTLAEQGGFAGRGRSMASVLSPSTSRYARTGIPASARTSASTSATTSATTANQRRIRLRVDGSGVARVLISGFPSSRRSPTGMVLASRRVAHSAMPAAWAAEFSRIMFADPAMMSAGTLVVADRSGRIGDGFVRSVAHSRTVPQDRVRSDAGRDEGDPRDAWLALGFENPAEFAEYIAGRNLAEQELWTARLSERAEARGLLTDFLRTLRESGDTTAAWIADDFSAQAKARSSRETSSAATVSPR